MNTDLTKELADMKNRMDDITSKALPNFKSTPINKHWRKIFDLKIAYFQDEGEKKIEAIRQQ